MLAKFSVTIFPYPIAILIAVQHSEMEEWFLNSAISEGETHHPPSLNVPQTPLWSRLKPAEERYAINIITIVLLCGTLLASLSVQKSNWLQNTMNSFWVQRHLVVYERHIDVKDQKRFFLFRVFIPNNT